MRLGIDVSTYFEEKDAKAKYYDGNKEVEPLELFTENGVDLMRIRVWVDPYNSDGKPYLGGTCDLENFLKLSKLGMEKGYKIMLDIHYSDFWADPSKQNIPKKWQNLDEKGLTGKVRDYTFSLLERIKKEGIPLEYIQIGNEITNGMLWPYGRLTEGKNGEKRGNYKNFTDFLKAGISSARSVMPNAKLILHLERSYDINVYNEFFTEMESFGVDYDAIGFSYYPYWHGTLQEFFKNVENCKKFNKELLVVETGYAFTLEDYINDPSGGGHLVVAESNVDGFSFKREFPLNKQGQADFTKALIKGCTRHGVSAVIWWEPLWIPGKNICWASVEGQEYINECGKSTRNEWANQCMFDYQGNKNPVFDVYKIK